MKLLSTSLFEVTVLLRIPCCNLVFTNTLTHGEKRKDGYSRVYGDFEIRSTKKLSKKSEQT